MMVNGRKIDGSTSDRFVYLKNDISGNPKSTPSGRTGPVPVGQFSRVNPPRQQQNNGNQLSNLVSHKQESQNQNSSKPIYDMQISKKLDQGYKRRFTETRKLDRNFENSRKRMQLIELRKQFTLGANKKSFPDTGISRQGDIQKVATVGTFGTETAQMALKRSTGLQNKKTQFVDDLAMYSDQNLALNQLT